MVFVIRIPFVLSATDVFRTNNLISSTDLGQLRWIPLKVRAIGAKINY